MTFDSRENSADQGDKVFTYTWVRGSRFYRYAASASDVVLDFQTYTGSGGISHSEIEQGGEPVRANVTVKVPSNHPIAAMYRATPPMDRIVLTIEEYHVGEESDRRPTWQGRVSGCKFDPVSMTATLNHEPTYTSMRRTGLRRVYQRNCPWVLYGARCRVNRELYALDFTATEVTSITITAAAIGAAGADWWVGGMLEWEIASGVFDRRFVSRQDGDTITLHAPLVSFPAGTPARLFPGCDRTGETCDSKFDNLPNFGGFLYFPGKNPFGGSPIY